MKFVKFGQVVNSSQYTKFQEFPLGLFEDCTKCFHGNTTMNTDTDWLIDRFLYTQR